MEVTIQREGSFEYVEEGEGYPLVLLHGLFGALSNWRHVLDDFTQKFRVIIPMMPIYKKTKVQPSIEGLAGFIQEFMDFKGIRKSVIIGNSLGGHIAQVFALRNPSRLDGMVLTGSSGLFESGMGSTFPKRGNKTYIRERVEYTFFDPHTASEELVDEVFDIVNDNYKTLRILKIARNAQRENLREVIGTIQAPTLLVWGLNDNITPPNVAHEFHKLLPHSELRFIDQCGHAAMMEQPVKFNTILKNYLNKLNI